MSEISHSIASLLARISLVQEIERIAQEKHSDYQWQNNKYFIDFIKELKPHISSNENDWDKNDEFLKLSHAIHNGIIEQLNVREGEKMTTPTTEANTVSIGTLAIVSGLSILIGIAIGVYYYKNSKKDKSDRNKENQSF